MRPFRVTVRKTGASFPTPASPASSYRIGKGAASPTRRPTRRRYKRK